MILKNIAVNPYQVKDYFCITLSSQGPANGFPFLSVDRDSYIIGLEVQSGIGEDIQGGRHCIAIGKCCSVAEGITFMIDYNHDFASVCQGELFFMEGVPKHKKIHQKASVILQNEVWIGRGATIMAGVTLHNGCVVAANSVVTKDVPPYAIVGGNPARIIRYWFDEPTIAALQKIAWWDWDSQLQYKRRDDFALSVAEFTAKYLPEAEAKFQALQIAHPRTGVRERKTILFIPDFTEPFPLYPKVLDEYFSQDRADLELLIYISEPDSTPENLRILEAILQKHNERDCNVILQTGETMNEHILFQYADYFVTTRHRETVARTCLADMYQARILYGTDLPVFYSKNS